MSDFPHATTHQNEKYMVKVRKSTQNRRQNRNAVKKHSLVKNKRNRIERNIAEMKQLHGSNLNDRVR